MPDFFKFIGLTDGALGRSGGWEPRPGSLNEELLSALGVRFEDIRSFQVLHQSTDRLLTRIRIGDTWQVLLEGSGAPGREFACYRLLLSHDIPTLPVYGMIEGDWGYAMLLEDVSGSPLWHAAARRDADRWEVGRALGRWYRRFHEAGRQAIEDPNASMLSREIDVLTVESLWETAARLRMDDHRVWRMAADAVEHLKARAASLPQTLVYNDFSWENMALMDTTTLLDDDTPFPAVMFEFTQMGVGTVYADVRSACYNLSEDARTAFLDEYSPEVDPLEKALDKALAPLMALHVAARMDRLPPWASQSMDMIGDGELERAIHLASDRL